MKNVLSLLTGLFLTFQVQALNIAIVESQSLHVEHLMDENWQTVVNDMGHNSFIVQQWYLDDPSFFDQIDILIISSGGINLPSSRANTIAEFIKQGKSVYYQSEYLPTLSTNIGFTNIVTALGGSFSWTNLHEYNIAPINVLGTLSTNNNVVDVLSYYWYSVSGVGDCNTINYLEKDGEYHGFHFIPPNPNYGTIITNTDQDWVNQLISIDLMENIITQLIDPQFTDDVLQLPLGNDTTICENDTLTLDATQANATYLWQDGSTNSTFDVVEPGTYFVEISNECGSISDTITVLSNPLPVVDLGENTTICPGENLILDVTNDDATYLWQDGSTDATFHVQEPGIYFVLVSNSCASLADTIEINNHDSIMINLGNDTLLCEGESLTLDATTNHANYVWQDGSTSPTFEVQEAGIYSVEVSTACGSTTDMIEVGFFSEAFIDLGSDMVICENDVLILDASATDGAYLWQDGSTDETFDVLEAGLYWVEVSNNCGTISDSITVSTENCNCQIYIPSAFSPNNDRINDSFSSFYNCTILEYDLKIFDRWGAKIFESDDPERMWDGTFNSQTVSNGTYAYVVTYKFEGDQVPDVQHGSVTVVR